MHAIPTTPQAHEAPAVDDHATGGTSADDGLRSARGIRWLLLVGALVVAVSVVRLLAARWGELQLAVQFLVLAAGTLTVFAAGVVTRHRLRLPVAGSALLFLFAALVPLWTWGAAYLELLAEPSGWAVFLISLAAFTVAGRRVLERTLGYRGAFYPAALGVLLLAMPVLPWLAQGFEGRQPVFFLTAAGALGLVLRAASRHVNRFFFHRDRLLGRSGDHPVHLLPFALLVLVYGAAISLLGSFDVHAGRALFDVHHAVALALIAVALIDTGEEYYRALVRASGGRPDRWPARSVGLLALGFGAMASALGASTLTFSGRSLALVTSIAAARLLAWGLRYRNPLAYVLALISGIVAYHAFPALVPEAVKDVFRMLCEAAGIGAGSPAAVSLADLGLLAAFMVLGAVLRRRLTPALAKAHWTVCAVNACLLLTVGLFDVRGLVAVAPAAAVLLMSGVAFFRRRELLPPLYQAVVTTALAWAPVRDEIWQPESAIWVFGANLLYLAAGWWMVRRARWFDDRGGNPAGMLLVAPPLAVMALTLPLLLEASAVEAGLLALLASASCALSYLLLPQRWLLGSALAAFGGGLGLLASEWSATAAAFALLVAAVIDQALATAWTRAGREDLSVLGRRTAMVFGAVAAGVAIHATAETSGGTWAAILPAFLASLFFTLLAGRDRAPEGAGLDGERSGARTTDEDFERSLAATCATGIFAAAFIVWVDAAGFAEELFWCGPGLALLGLVALLRRRLGEVWSQRLFTLGAGCLYAMPVFGLLDEITWGWQIVLLLFAVAFGAWSFRLRSRPLLLVSTGALVTDLTFFLLKLRQTEPLLLWAAGIVFGLGLMAAAAFLEHRREKVLQHLRVWGQEIRSWA